MQLPEKFLQSLSGIQGYDAASFEAVHLAADQVTSIRTNTAKIHSPRELLFNDLIGTKVPWCATGYYLDARPSFTFDPLWHAGCYYVQEASSMFVEQALKQAVDLSQDIKVLDLCAAPGGKSTLIQSLITPGSVLVCNEVIASRTNILTDNIMRWGTRNVVISRNDAATFQKLPGYFDVILVDAPCSGSGLFRRDESAIEEWSLENVQLCCQRQQKILEDVLPALKENGILVYATCSFSQEEDEDISNWLRQSFDLEPVPLQVPENWNIVNCTIGGISHGYRFFPDKLKGEGFYISCLQKIGSTPPFQFKKIQRTATLNKQNTAIIGQWVAADSMNYYAFYDKVIAWPSGLDQDFDILIKVLNVKYAGLMIGEIIRDKLVPHHALALSGLTAATINEMPLDHRNAVRYLQRKEIETNAESKGWHLVSFNNHNLGWVNVLPNRINNYYPKELRILKEME